MWAIPTGASWLLKKKKKVPVLSLASRKPVRIRQSGRTGIRGVTSIIANPFSVFLMKTHGQIELFTYPSLTKYWLKRLYHIRPDCFNPYKDLCNLIEYMLRGFEFIASGNVNPLGIFIYKLASRDPYKYAVTTSIRCISSPSETAKLIKYRNVIASIAGEYVSS